MAIQEYINDINALYKRGQATEHSYRPALQIYLTELFTLSGIDVTNEPKRQECGAPDYILSKKGIDVGYIEAKDIGADLSKTEKSEQLKRYRESLGSLILTDYMEFRFFVDGKKVAQVAIARLENKTIVPIPESFEKLESLLQDFITFPGQTIKSAKKLAVMMARKARLMCDVFYKAVQENSDNQSLREQFKAMQAVLMHDMDEKQFADVYAQTVAFGLFTARLHDKTLEDFSREEARDLIPKSNPFLCQLFFYVTGPDLDERVVWIVNALCDVYRAANVEAILKDFGTATGQNDPILHFYETFLGEYDKKLKKARGVWYTPEPVVNFIVRAIDDVLKDHFGLKDGLADTSKIKIQVEDKENGSKLVEQEVHKVQLLDVATGTGTFLAEVVKQIYSRFKGQEGLWSSYVEEHLLPRLHGFELLMASYAMCHMKLDLLLQETGYKPSNPQKPPRLSVYLTNSLEEHHPELENRFANWLSKEANEASRIKKDMPIMVAFGNPPYSGESSNKGRWILDILNVYKQEPGGGKLKERNSKWLNDDYVKFIRLGEHYIEKNGEGILAYITNNGYLENPTFRGMRWNLLTTFDDIYILDLHGNSKKKEVTPDGQPDKNVFDIQQGVAIIIGVKHNCKAGKNSLAKVHHSNLWGNREKKYNFLEKNALGSVNWTMLELSEPEYFFIPINYSLQKEYKRGFSVRDLFPINSVGIVTARDALTIHKNKKSLIKAYEKFCSLSVEEARIEFKLGKDVRDWKVQWAQDDLKNTDLNSKNVRPINYRPFDTRWTYYTGRSRGFLCMPRPEVMQHFLAGENIGLSTTKSIEIKRGFEHVFITNKLTTHHTVSIKEVNYIFPLYVYHNDLGAGETKSPNFNQKIYSKIKSAVADVTPESLFDYIYAVLHSPEYRKRYADYLRSDFPHIPYPKDTKAFNDLAEHGAQLRDLHLMENAKLNDLMTTYPVDGNHEVIKPRFEEGKVWINDTQYFGGVPQVAWEFYIGGYQPAQKWLKDRRRRKLSVDDIRHWQRIIVALTETDKIMREIDDIDFLPK